jgi:hypothetical protein
MDSLLEEVLEVQTTSADRLRLGYFIGYAFWNYLTTPFVFTLSRGRGPGVRTVVRVWTDVAAAAGGVPSPIATHHPEKGFHFDHSGLQRRIDFASYAMPELADRA